MEENYLQVAFEIKLACDAISRRLLRWHWEKTPRPHTLQELMRHLEQRSVEAADYYQNIATHEQATTWQQLDTTFCMRIMLDAEADAKSPKKLLQYALNEGAARHACNGLRIARNAAAHATDKAGVVKAIAVFEDTLIDLENAYGMTLFTPAELEQYDALAKRAVATCTGKSAASANAKAAPKKAASAPKKATSTRGKAGASTPTPTRKASPRGAKTPQPPAKQGATISTEVVFVCLAVVVFLAAFCVHFAR